MSKTTNRLGRGLNALISPRDLQTADRIHETLATADAGQLRHIAVEQIVPNPKQPRSGFDDATLRDLADSIRANGILQPVIVRSLPDQRFELVAGERRWRAAKLAGVKTIPATVRELSDGDSFTTALIENLQREDLGPLERSAAYQHYLDTFGGTVEDLAARLNESRANISNYLRLLKLRPEICYMLGTGELAMGQARAIAGIVDPQRQLAVARLATRRNLSVRQVEALAKVEAERQGTSKADPQPAEPVPQHRHVADVEQSLSRSLGLRVRLHPGKKKNSGRVVVFYSNLQEFDRIAEHLGGQANLE
jgi:ParB family chromosome partitioning protein